MIMEQMLLDRSGLLDAPENYHLVATEVDFLIEALSKNNLFIQKELCNWAEAFCKARGITYRELNSPLKELLSVFPKLSESQAEDLIMKTKIKIIEIPPPLTKQKILNTLFPNNIWFEPPSITHAAKWLLWLNESEDNEYLLPLLEDITTEWQDSSPENIRFIYSSNIKNIAKEIIEEWLGFRKNLEHRFFEPFQVEVPKEFIQKAGDCYLKRIVESDGKDIIEISQLPLTINLKKTIFKKCYEFLVHNPQKITHELVEIISPHVGIDEQLVLRKHLPPARPLPIPQKPDEVLEWVRTEYIPFRFWQMGEKSPETHQVTLDLAKQFIDWFLSQYPSALAGNRMNGLLSYAKLIDLVKEDINYSILIIVLDGLHLIDGDYLLNRILEKCSRLTVIDRTATFSVLPTITQFSKESLFRGVPPSQLDKVEYIGKILPEGKLPINMIIEMKPGQCGIWSIVEPDHTYHKKKAHDPNALVHSVEAQLDSVANNIYDIVGIVPEEIPLKIIITSDHGRLLSKSSRKLPIPDRMVNHGRAAWRDQAEIHYEKEGFIIQNDLVFLNPDLFCIPCETAISLGEDTFLQSNGAGGTDLFSHGGLFPEEVVVPMYVLCRDYERPSVESILSGKGIFGQTSKLMITINNHSDLELKLSHLIIRYKDKPENKLDIDFKVMPVKSNVFEIEFGPWPSSNEIKTMQVRIVLEQKNHFKFELEPSIVIEAEEMYTGDQTLEGLV